jgi:hypothetical protein
MSPEALASDAFSRPNATGSVKPLPLLVHAQRGFFMTRGFIAGAAFFALALGAPAFAQSAPARGEGAITLAQASPAAEEPAKSRRSKKKASASKREPTASQMAARERQRKCAAEWKEAKAAGKTNGLKWPKYWSQCNARLKGNSA